MSAWAGVGWPNLTKLVHIVVTCTVQYTVQYVQCTVQCADLQGQPTVLGVEGVLLSAPGVPLQEQLVTVAHPGDVVFVHTRGPHVVVLALDNGYTSEIMSVLKILYIYAQNI